MGRQYFGTDGIRGRVGEYPITPDFVLKLGWAVGRVLAQQDRDLVLIGKDTRISGYMFESALEAGLSAAGVDIRLLGPMPTPAIAYLTSTLRAGAGIVISASHNPHEDNGIKFFSADGEKLDDATEERIEALLQESLTTVNSSALGKVARLEDAPGRYIEFCKSSVERQLRLDGMRLVLDCANGATYHVGPEVFRELGAEVVVIGNRPDGLNINVDCGSTSPQGLQKAVIEHGAHAGIAFDGDGDRLVMVDENGEILDGDELLFIIARGRQREGALRGPVVGTLMSNLGLELALRELGVDFIRAKVGDRYVLEQLKRESGILGGESSGHILCLDRTTTGDGIISALQVLEVLHRENVSLAEARGGMTKYPQHMINVPVGRVRAIDDNATIADAVRLTESALGDQGRVLLRPSGTEPVIRVMVEGRDAASVRQHAQTLADAVKRALA
ncbi:phosphoglucosamine mutase [Natronocella acetinitrilica]|uniref:Phosphoglucosamine mutase n=1 Tax=Natronocella acetinitrilica TaxID=414046 RepID=A0AAE3G4R1_9GAMM|nr:phosphoglucosamine mutase [Natronocella acetinitrilica]MCP1674726.1 phosphoglucosamine mutase [Natronocella acetinitrilica]